jgi:hypothetical protein
VSCDAFGAEPDAGTNENYIIHFAVGKAALLVGYLLSISPTAIQFMQ